MKKTNIILFILCLIFSSDLLAQNIKKVGLYASKNWTVEHNVKEIGAYKTNYFSASVFSLDKNLELKISCKAIEGEGESKHIKIKVLSNKNTFLQAPQVVNFIFDKRFENVFSYPAGQFEKIKENSLIINNNFNLSNLIATNAKTTLQFKDEKQNLIKSNFNLEGGLEAITYLGQKCFIEPKKTKK